MHTSSRPLLLMTAAGSYVLKVGKPREKIVDSVALKQYLHQTSKFVRVINDQQEDIKDDLASGMRDVRHGIKHKLRTIDMTMLKELKKIRISARKEMQKNPYVDPDAAVASQVSQFVCVCCCCWFVFTSYPLLRYTCTHPPK